MAINQPTVTNKVLRIKSPTGAFFDVDAVVYTAANGQAKFSFGRTFTSTDNGTWEVFTSETDKVLDSAGNAVVGGVKIGSFTVNIPTPSDTTPPTVTLISITPSNILTAGNTTVDILVQYTD